MVRQKSKASEQRQQQYQSKQNATSSADPLISKEAIADDSSIILQLGFLAAAIFLFPRSALSFQPASSSSSSSIGDSTESVLINQIPQEGETIILNNEENLASGFSVISEIMRPIVEHPIESLTMTCLGVGIIQAWYGTHLRKRRLEAELRQEQSQQDDNGKKSKNNIVKPVQTLSWTVIFDAVSTTLIAIVIIQFGFVLLGAPVFRSFRRTALLSTFMSLLTISPMAWTFPPPWKAPWTWNRLLSLLSPNGRIEGRLLLPLVGAVLGAYFGSMPILLDWDRDWQQWPITCVFGAYMGHVAGSLYAIIAKR